MTETTDILEQPLVSLPGIGRQTAFRLQKLHLERILDLLFHIPIRYEDRTRIHPIGSLQHGASALICGRVELTDVVAGRRRSLVCRISDGTGFLTLRFFYFSVKQHLQLKPGTWLQCFGEVRYGYAELEMVHPEYKIVTSRDDCLTETHLTPVYALTEGVRQNTLRKAVSQALNLYQKNEHTLIDWLPDSVQHRLSLPGLREAIYSLHAPRHLPPLNTGSNETHLAIQRLAFEELLAHHLSLKQSKRQNQQLRAPVLNADPTQRDQFFAALPFTLTGAQHRVIQEVAADCSRNKPMMRLIQGDVGCGKTIVCAYAALLAIHSGCQAAIMAPTELLAEQHYRNFLTWFKPFDVRIGLLTGQLKGARKQELLQSLEHGETKVIIGTHALFQDSVCFSKLGLVIIDEQHRFGVHQRLALREKGGTEGTRPHQLVMTATPIPRTLAMLNYSDLDISLIDELPPGRKPIVTRALPAERRQQVIDKISGWIKQGRQAYWVCTLIEESEVLQCEAAEKTRETLSRLLPEIRVALVHGRMKAAEKEQIMQHFKQHRIDLLVATTVIEVGVDVPNAGLMIIENPERLGLAQLHQLRGRVGRVSDDSYCLLMYQSPLSTTARERLNVLRETGDGFIIAEKDLHLRGPGELLGTRQTGEIRFKVADLSRDEGLLAKACEAADIIRQQCPEAIQPLINRWLGKRTELVDI